MLFLSPMSNLFAGATVVPFWDATVAPFWDTVKRAGGTLIFHIFEALAEFERDIIQEGFPEEYAKFLAVALPWAISGTDVSHLLTPLTS